MFLRQRSGRIHRPIQVPVSAFHLNIGFVDSVGFVGRLEVRAAALIEFRPKDLDPAPDAGSMNMKAAFIHEIRHLPVAQREAQSTNAHTRG